MYVHPRIAGALAGAVLAGGVGLAAAAPASAKSYFVFEAGRAKISAGLVQCKQFVMERDGADIRYFHVQPWVEKFQGTKTVKYRDKNGKLQTKKVELWKAVGGTSNPARENKTFGGRGQNAQVATGSFQNPRGAWTFSRHVEGHGVYRCVGFVSGTAIDASGKLHKIGPVKAIGPNVNSSHR